MESLMDKLILKYKQGMNMAQIDKRIDFLKEELHKKGIYKYVCDGKIIYIGRSYTSILNRIEAHETEYKFRSYLKTCQIYFISLETDAQVTAAEAMLIEKYKPVLNVQYKTDVFPLFDIEPFLPEWIPFSRLQEFRTELRCLQKVQADMGY